LILSCIFFVSYFLSTNSFYFFSLTSVVSTRIQFDDYVGNRPPIFVTTNTSSTRTWPNGNTSLSFGLSSPILRMATNHFIYCQICVHCSGKVNFFILFLYSIYLVWNNRFILLMELVFQLLLVLLLPLVVHLSKLQLKVSVILLMLTGQILMLMWSLTIPLGIFNLQYYWNNLKLQVDLFAAVQLQQQLQYQSIRIMEIFHP
jgi:hypothetical protein